MKGTNHKTIDYKYIWKKLNNISSDEEDRLLNEWLDDSTENEQFFLKAKGYDAKLNVDNTPFALSIFKQKLQRQKRKRMMAYSSAAVFLLLISGYWLISIIDKNNNDLDSLLASKVQDVPTLVLSDGTKMELTDESNIHLLEVGATVSSKNGHLTYLSNGNMQNRLAYNTIHVPRGRQLFLVLSDSTKIWINSETQLRYPTSFPNNERRVELVGEAYFEVQGNKTKPFRVITGNHEIFVTGTSFNVSTFGEVNTITTTLVEGKVQIKDLRAKKILGKLEPGAQSVYSVENKSILVNEVNVTMFTSWKDGYYFFQNETIENILKTLSRWYNVDFEIKNDKKCSTRFTGKLKRTDAIQQILSKIEKTNEINFDIYDDKVVVN